MLLNYKFNGTRKDLANIFNLYKLDVLKFHRFKDGIINVSYCLEMVDRSKLVMRVYQRGNKSNDQIIKELDFMDIIKISGVPVPNIIHNIYGEQLTIVKDLTGKEWRVVLMTFAEGRHLMPQDYSLISEFALYQAKMHVVSSRLISDGKTSNFSDMVDWMDKEFEKAKYKEISKVTLTIIRNIYIELKQIIKMNIKQIYALPRGFVHLDYDSDNIMVSNGRISAILDFDDISNQPFILDSAHSLWWWVFNNKEKDYSKILKLYFESYQKVRKITNNERRFLSLFLRMRNITLMCLLYITNVEKINYNRVIDGIELDSVIKSSSGLSSMVEP